jgi:hypothetical protein
MSGTRRSHGNRETTHPPTERGLRMRFGGVRAPAICQCNRQLLRPSLDGERLASPLCLLSERLEQAKDPSWHEREAWRFERS